MPVRTMLCDPAASLPPTCRITTDADAETSTGSVPLVVTVAALTPAPVASKPPGKVITYLSGPDKTSAVAVVKTMVYVVDIPA